MVIRCDAESVRLTPTSSDVGRGAVTAAAAAVLDSPDVLYELAICHWLLLLLHALKPHRLFYPTIRTVVRMLNPDNLKASPVFPGARRAVDP